MFRSSDIPRLLAVAGIAVLAACSDATAPAKRPSLASPSLAAPMAPASIRHDVIINAMHTTEDSLLVEFTVTPSGGWFVAGANAVFFPPNSICEPTTSGYGRDLWDASCDPATGPVVIHGRAGLRGAQVGWIQFDEDLRFVPSDDPERWVRIYMYSEELRGDRPEDFLEREQAYGIVWVPTPGAEAVDEAQHDITLQTQVQWGAGLVTRRVKHFSGYQVTNGIVEDALEY
jgi:hypothetical protein